MESYCTGYGGQTHVSTTGNCGSTACGIITGGAALLVSRARDLGYCSGSRPEDPACTEPDLSANEVKQIITLTAEKPNDPASCFGVLTNAPCKKDTWDLHQGYGRMNMIRALHRLEEGPLPPEVEILSPGWFALLDPGKASAGNLTARVSSRVPLGPVTCEWAPGIEPEEPDFLPVSCQPDPEGRVELNLPLGSMAGALGGAEIAPADPEGKAVTVRIRARTRDGYGEDRRVFAVYRDPDWLEGFPISLADRDGDGLEDISPEAENAWSLEASPALQDLDGDGLDEIILVNSNAQIHVLAYDTDLGTPRHVAGYPIQLMRTARSRDGVGAAPAVGDLDRDGYPDIVVSTLAGYLYAFRGLDAEPLAGPDGRILAADPPINDSAESYGAGNAFFGSPVLVDLNQDGYLDVVAACGDQKVYAVDGHSIAQGEAVSMAGWPVRTEDPDHCGQLATSILSTPAAADLTGDGSPEVIVGTSESCHAPRGSARLYAIRPSGMVDPRGPFLEGFPVVVDPNFLRLELPLPPLTTGIPGSPVVARMGDEMVIGTGAFLGPFVLVHVRQEGDETVTVSTENLLNLSFGAAGSGAFHRGAREELAYAIAAVTLGPAGDSGLVQFVHQTPLFLPEILPFPVATYPSEDYQFLSNPSFADVDGDGQTEVVTVNGGHFIHAFDRTGLEPEGWPRFTYGWHMASPAFGDIDGDGLLDMVAPAREGRIFAWHTEAPVCGAHSWTTFHHDNRRTGSLETPFWEERCRTGLP
jgi:hypothetical protein